MEQKVDERGPAVMCVCNFKRWKVYTCMCFIQMEKENKKTAGDRD